MSATPTNYKTVSKAAVRLLVSLTILLFSYTLCLAIPAAEYQKKIQTAVSSLASLLSPDEQEEGNDYRERVSEQVESVRQTLLKKDTVQVGDHIIDVDNTWLHIALDIVESQSGEQQQQVLTSTIERLKALEHRVGELELAAREGLTKGEAQARLDEILKRSEYNKGPQGKNALTRLIEKLKEWLRGFFPKSSPMEPGRIGTVSYVIRVIVIAVALAMIAYALYAGIRRLPRRQKKVKKVREARVVLGERLEPEASATDLLSDAETLARSGDIRGAIRKAYVALLVELADRHIVSLAQHKTNRDYVRSVRNIPVLHSKMLALTDSFERHWYGFIDATPSDWQDFRNGYQAALQTKS